MLPRYGRVVAGNSGRPQFENGAGSIPFSGHGGAGGVSAPTGANTCCSQIACSCWASLVMVGSRIGLAAAAPHPSSAAATVVTATLTKRRLIPAVTPTSLHR
jgi:hypothetical protein